jgi:hypothetical protein
LFFDTVPTLSAIGPLEHLAPMEDIAASLSSSPPFRANRPLMNRRSTLPGVMRMPKSVFRFLSRQPEADRA